jgi:N-acyl homoserine lactone hydrolase
MLNWSDLKFGAVGRALLRSSRGLLVSAIASFCAVVVAGAQPAPEMKSPRVYVMDCGLLTRGDPMLRFGLTTEQVGGLTDLVTPCFLIVHAKGTILWDTGMVPDRLVRPGGNATIVGNTPNWTAEQVFNKPEDTIGPTIVFRSLKEQLAEIGYRPADITYLVLSHGHVDHVANANDYAGSTWIVQKAEREFMFSDALRKAPWFANYDKLENARTIELQGDYDIFGDGTVVIKSTPGHTPGHQSLFVRLQNTGPILISGDLYHYEAGRKFNIVPPNRDDVEQTKASRARMEQFMTETHAALWIQHSLRHFRELKKSPAYYD